MEILNREDVKNEFKYNETSYRTIIKRYIPIYLFIYYIRYYQFFINFRNICIINA